MHDTKSRQMPLKFKPSVSDCRRCGVELLSRPSSESLPAPENRFMSICRDVHDCHRRMMHGRLRVLQGGARY